LSVSLPATILRSQRFSSVRKTLALLSTLYSISAAAEVLDPPSLRCASVDLAGDVTLTWVVPSDPGNIFQEYAIYCSTVSASGPYTVVGTSPVYGLSNWTHGGAGANTGSRWYFVTTITVDPPPNESFASDTLQTIFLQVAQSTPLGSAVLDWNVLHDPLLPTTAIDQEVLMEYPVGTWSTQHIVGPSVEHLEQVIDICDDSLTWRIAVADQLGCVSYSNLDGGQFADVTAPSPPEVVTVSVDTATNQVVITWEQSPEPDTDGYIIILLDNGFPILIDTIFGQTDTSFSWVNSAAGAGAEAWTVAAFDTCLAGDPPAPNTSATESAHTSIFASTFYDRCEASCLVTWSHYVGWDVVSYEVYAALNGAPPVLITTVQGFASSFLHETLVPFAEYCYVVKAIGAEPWMRSLSNQVCKETDYPALPQSNYLSLVTVAAPNHIVVEDQVDQSASVRRYRLERSNNGEPWEQVASQPGGVAPSIIFNDLDVLTDLRSYTYRVVVEDSCGVEAVTSNDGTSILLLVEAGNDGVNRLRWNGYEDWAGNVSGYAVYRSVGDGPFIQIHFGGPTDWEAEDNVNSFTYSNGRFCYYVEALETGNPTGANAISTSNIACAIQPEGVWVPNAFNPSSAESANVAFKPIVAFVDVKGYEFNIYNRWGQLIWNTTDVYKAWDGRVNDNYVPQGVYAYYVAVLNGAGKKFEERGTVTFLCCP
jgi:gliding motility-associated-like protein